MTRTRGRPKHAHIRKVFEALALYPGTFHCLRFLSTFLLHARHAITDADDLRDWFGDLLKGGVFPGDVHPSHTACGDLGWRKVLIHLRRGQCHELAHAIICRRLRVKATQLDHLLRQARAGWPRAEAIYDERFWCAHLVKDVRAAKSRIAKRELAEEYDRYRMAWPLSELQAALRIYLNETSPEVFHALLRSGHRGKNADALRRYLERYHRGDLGQADAVGAEAFLAYAAESGEPRPEGLTDDDLLGLMSKWLVMVGSFLREIRAPEAG